MVQSIPHQLEHARANAGRPGLRPENQLLICAARRQLDPANKERIRQLLREDLDWQYLLSMAHRHGVIPLLHLHLNEISADLPSEVISWLRDLNYEISRSNLYLTGELIKLAEFFQGHAIQVVPFKGPALALSAYGDLGLRQFIDLDILVRRADVPAVRELLIGKGFQPTPELNEGAVIRFDCAQNFSSEANLMLDVHWDIAAPYLSLRLDSSEFWDRLETLTINGRKIETVASEDLLLILCLHGFTHMWERLGWICDVAALIDRQDELDWDAVLQNAIKMGGRRILSLGLFLANRVLETPIPPQVSQVAPADAVVMSLAEKIEAQLFDGGNRLGLVEGAQVHLSMRERRRDQLSMAFRFATTPKIDDWKLISLPEWLFFLYYAVRPLRLAGKYGLKLLKGADSQDKNKDN